MVIVEKIFWLATIFVAFSGASSLIASGPNSVCTETVSQPDYYSEYSYDEANETTWKTETDIDRSTRQKCCSGYKEKNGVCEPWCLIKCINGYCAQPDTCACNAGFEPVNFFVCKAICSETCVNGFCESPEKCGCFEGYIRSKKDNNTCDPVCENCTNGDCVAPGKCKCKQGFAEKENGNCVAKCEPECVNGVCSAEGCVCSSGWRGDICEEPYVCFLAQKTVLKSSTIPSDAPVSSEAEDTIDNTRPKWTEPECDSKCSDDLDGIFINFTRTFGNTTYQFIPIDSPCNVVSKYLLFVKKHIYEAGGIVAVLLLVILVSTIVCISRRTRRNRTRKTTGAGECMVNNEL